MTEYEVPIPAESPAGPSFAPRRSPWLALSILLLLAAAAALGYAGLRLWQAREQAEDTAAAQDTLLRRLSRQLGDTQAEIEQLRERQGDFGNTLKRNVDEVASLQGRVDDADATIGRINAALQGGRGRAQLVAVEQLLLIANERALLAHDAKGAVDALSLAQDRLGALAEPKLFDIRQAVAQELGAMQALPQVDLEAAALSLSDLITKAPQLPQRSRAPHRLDTAAAEPDRELRPEAHGWWSHGWASMREVLGAVFVLRRTDKPVDRLLPVEQETLVAQLLLLKLESARAALLLGQSEALHGAVNDAALFLADYFRPDDPGVLAARAELERLRTLDLAPKLPDLSRSLGLLRAYLDAAPR